MRALLRICVALVACAAPLAAQRHTGVEISLPARGLRSVEPPEVRCVRVLSDSRLRDLLRNGFPARLHYRLEIWSTRGWFDDLAGSTEWDVIVRYRPLDRLYEVVRIDSEGDPTVLGRFEQFDAVVEAVERPQRPPLRAPARNERFYYNLSLDVEMLSVSDLDEVERWLRGEFRPAVRGRRNPGTALTRGLRTIVVKLLGGEKRHYEARTGTFWAGSRE